LKKQLDIPATIREAGVPEKEYKEEIGRMAEIAFEDQCIVSNSTYPLVEDLRNILWEAFDKG